LGIGQHVAIVGVGLAHAELGGLLLQPVGTARAQRRKFEAGQADDGFAVDLAEPAQTDHADADRAHRLLLPTLECFLSVQNGSTVSSRAMTILPAVSPQSTGSTAPVMAAAASEHRKAATLATSSGSTMRPSGYQRTSSSRTFGLRDARSSHSGVRTVPGRM